MSQSLRQLNEARLEVFETLLKTGKVLLVCDPTLFGVRVPDWLKQEYGNELPLRFGYHNGGLTFDVQGVSETLSFKGSPHRVSIPWSAVKAMLGEDGRGWSASQPGDAESTEVKPVTSGEPAPVAKPRPKLRLVPDPDPESSN